MINNANITNFSFSRLTLNDTVEQLSEWVNAEDFTSARTGAFVNPHSLEVARKDSAFANAILASDLVAADGIGIVLASRILGAGIPEKVCGPDFFQAFCEMLNSNKKIVRMFFLGSSHENLLKLEARFKKDFPNLCFAGAYSPPFRSEFSEEDNKKMALLVNNSAADVLWVGLGAPKQEKWAEAIRGAVNAKLILSVGAVFDFYTDRVKLPPKWAHRAGLTFVYRFFQQPFRLFRRNLDSPIFILRVLRQRFFGNSS